jgi:hypothetical protein
MKGNPHIKTALVGAAWSAARTMRSEFEDRYRRLAPTIRHKRAVVAAAHLLALRVYQVLDSCTSYQPKIGTLTPLAVKRLVRHHTRRLNCFKRWLNDGEPRPAYDVFRTTLITYRGLKRRCCHSDRSFGETYSARRTSTTSNRAIRRVATQMLPAATRQIAIITKT